ncbi:hypothetical protein [Paenibacillus campinasensis]|uniref:FecR protein domain-containing protein n=1 Tax=Paenibacillus campinasensis TaxID=66347 RepID=A0A268EVV6_9BACL|nr:hypothetical protein [Paenibacillus campinasensis]PAD77214.1 hypothetical protein CHH67_09375 [Paenibacillus campinasensis]
MMTKRKYFAAIISACICIGAGSILSVKVNSASTTPGTTDDPVVTKSYVDQQIQKALGGGGTTTNPTPTPSTPEQNSNEVKNVSLKPGQILVAETGTEFIVRSGNAVIYTEDSNGVADLTAGVDLLNGQAAPKNHLLSFPRDGRGIQVKPGQTSGLIVMVRGGYTVK